MQLAEMALTGSIVLGAAAYVLWALAPRRMRAKAGALAGRWAHSGAIPAILRAWLARFANAQTGPSGCSACGHRAQPSAPRIAMHDRARRRRTFLGRT